MRVLRAIWVVVVIVLCAGPAQAKSYYIASTDITADVRTDGSMHVREVRTFVFSGTFHAVDRFTDLPAGASVANIVVSEDGTPYREAPGESPGTWYMQRQGNRLQITWAYEATDETRTFALDFDVIGAVSKHADYAELYWQFIGTEWGVKSETARVTVNLPPGVPKAETKAWAHGPLWGKIEIGDSRVIFTCDPLPANKMLEGRILLPTAFSASSPRQDALEILPRVMAEQEVWVNEANAERRQARASLAFQIAAPAILAIIGIGVWLRAYLAYGREFKDPNAPQYLREPPSDSAPTEVAMIWKWGQLTPQDMTATVMDLVRRGALWLIVTTEHHQRLGGLLGESTEQGYAIERVCDYKGELRSSERYLVNEILFEGVAGDRISLEEFQQEAREEGSARHQGDRPGQPETHVCDHGPRSAVDCVLHRAGLDDAIARLRGLRRSRLPADPDEPRHPQADPGGGPRAPALAGVPPLSNRLLAAQGVPAAGSRPMGAVSRVRYHARGRRPGDRAVQGTLSASCRTGRRRNGIPALGHR